MNQGSHSKISLILLGLCVGVISLSSCVSSDFLYSKAYTHYTRHENDTALEVLHELSGKDPQYPPAYLLEATILEMQGNYAQAIAVLQKAKTLLPENENICFNLGILYFHLEEYDKAIQEYSQAITLNSGFAKAFLNRANAYLVVKKYNDALRDYESFIERTPEGYDNVRKLILILHRDLDAVSR